MKTEEFEKLGRVTSASVQKCTGKSWREWVELLERSGARNWTHGETTAFLKKKFKLGPWWQQGVAHGYEIAIGRKIEGRNAKGEYSTAASRTFAMNRKDAWNFLASKQGLEIWLKPLSTFALKPGSAFETANGAFGEVRTMKAGERARLKWREDDWDKHSTLQVIAIARKGEKSVIVIQHDKLTVSRVRDAYRDYWKKRLDELLAASKRRKK